MKDSQKDKAPPKGETPFQRFERLARKIVSVPKEKAQDKKGDKPKVQS